MENWAEAIRFCSPTHITAWDPVRQRRVWRVNHTDTVPAGLLSTAGDLLFQGTGTTFAAYDARTGERLWASEVGVGIIAPPISFSIDGEQYIAVMAGMGGSHGGHYTHFDYLNEGRLLAYKLGGRAPLPKVERRPPKLVDAPPLRASAERVSHGAELYARHCLFCHGMGARSSGLHPDLRFATRAVHDQWNDIVLGGLRLAGGMPIFADRLDAADAEAIHAYVISRALHEPSLAERLAGWLGSNACIPARWLAD